MKACLKIVEKIATYSLEVLTGFLNIFLKLMSHHNLKVSRQASCSISTMIEENNKVTALLVNNPINIESLTCIMHSDSNKVKIFFFEINN